MKKQKILDIIQSVCCEYGIRMDELLSRRRKPILVSARVTVIHTALILNNRTTLKEIGAALGNMHHASVIYLRDKGLDRFHHFEDHRPAHRRSLQTFNLL